MAKLTLLGSSASSGAPAEASAGAWTGRDRRSGRTATSWGKMDATRSGRRNRGDGNPGGNRGEGEAEEALGGEARAVAAGAAAAEVAAGAGVARRRSVGAGGMSVPVAKTPPARTIKSYLRCC